MSATPPASPRRPWISRRTLAGALVTAALLAAAGYWMVQRQTAARRMAAWRAEQASAAARDLLETLVTLPGGPMTLQEFADLMARLTGLPVELDVIAIENKVGADEPFSARVERVESILRGDKVAEPLVKDARSTRVLVPKGTLPVRSAFNVVLQPAGLVANLRPHQIVITTVPDPVSPNRLTTVVYPLPQPEPEGMNEEAWHAMLLGYANSPGCTVVAVPGALVVVTTTDDHRRIRQTIDAICNLRNSQPQPVVLPLVRGDMEGRIRAALEDPAEMEFVETPLAECARFLADRHDIPVILCVPQLQSAGVNIDAPVTKSLQGITLRSALRLMLKELDLTYIVRDDALFITTPDDAESRLHDVAYPVHDLVETGSAADYADLMRLITSTVAPQAWDDVGDPASLRQVGAGWLLVSQTDDLQEQVRELFGQLRQALEADAPAVIPLAESPAEVRIRAALNRPLAVQFDETPLKEAVGTLQNLLQIPIVLNAKTLADAGVNIDAPVTAKLPTGRAALQLELLLKQLDLTYHVRDEVVQITTPDDAESMLLVRLFNVRPLVATHASPEELASLLTGVASPQSWDTVGGPGAIYFYRGILLVGQTQPVLDEIEQLLAALDAHCIRDASAAPKSLRPIYLRASLQRDDLLRRLAEARDVNLPPLPLPEVLHTLQAEYEVPIVTEAKALANAGLPAPGWLSRSVAAKSLAAALDGAFQPRDAGKPADFGWLVREHLVVVSTLDAIENHQEIRLYWVGDLAARDRPAAHLRKVAAQILPGFQLGYFSYAIETIDPNWLIVRASQPGHRRLEAWLSEQRTGQSSAKGAAPWP